MIERLFWQLVRLSKMYRHCFLLCEHIVKIYGLCNPHLITSTKAHSKKVDNGIIQIQTPSRYVVFPCEISSKILKKGSNTTKYRHTIFPSASSVYQHKKPWITEKPTERTSSQLTSMEGQHGRHGNDDQRIGQQRPGPEQGRAAWAGTNPRHFDLARPSHARGGRFSWKPVINRWFWSLSMKLYDCHAEEKGWNNVHDKTDKCVVKNNIGYIDC